MSHGTLIVEERLRILERYMDWLEASAALASETGDAASWHKDELPEWAMRVAQESRAHLRAVKAALPVSCTNHVASLQ